MYVCDAGHTKKLKKPKQPRKPNEHFYLYSLHSRTPTELNGYFSYASESNEKGVVFVLLFVYLSHSNIGLVQTTSGKNDRAMLERWNVSSSAQIEILVRI